MPVLRPGDTAPEFRGECGDGTVRSSAEYRGHWLLLIFLRHFL